MKKVNSEFSKLRNDVLDLLKNEFKSSIVEKGKKFTCNIRFNNKNTLDKILITTSSCWNVVDTSFVSANSFDLNKNTAACSDQQQKQPRYFNNGNILNGSLRKINRFEINLPNNLMQQQQRRTFKTHRSVIAENQRNPSMLNRWRDAFNQQSNHEMEFDGKKFDSSHVSSSSSSSGGGLQNAKSMQHESLSKLLNQIEHNLTPEQKQQLKVSFAEGYLAASHAEKTQKEGRTLKYLRVLHLFLWICVGMAIIFSVFSTSNGSMFR